MKFIGYLILIAIVTTSVFRIFHTRSFDMKRAEKYLSEGRYSDAYLLFRKSIEKGASLNPTMVKEYSRAGLAAGDTATVIAYLETIVESSETDITVLTTIAPFFNDLGLFPLTIRACERVLSMRPEDRNTRIALARALHWTGNLEASIRQYKMALGE